MDGLTISTSQGLLEKGQTMKEIRNSELRAPFNSPASTDQTGKSFADTLKDAVNSVNDMQKLRTK